jgi:hypothetical protein
MARIPGSLEIIIAAAPVRTCAARNSHSRHTYIRATMERINVRRLESCSRNVEPWNKRRWYSVRPASAFSPIVSVLPFTLLVSKQALQPPSSRGGESERRICDGELHHHAPACRLGDAAFDSPDASSPLLEPMFSLLVSRARNAWALDQAALATGLLSRAVLLARKNRRLSHRRVAKTYYDLGKGLLTLDDATTARTQRTVSPTEECLHALVLMNNH